jgi:hypothetical protein
LLNAGCPQARETVLIDGKLPGQELVHGQRLTAAGFFEGQQAATDCGNNFGLAANDPPLGSRRRQVCNR